MAAVLIESLSSLIAVIGIKEIGYFSVPLFLLNLETFPKIFLRLSQNFSESLPNCLRSSRILFGDSQIRDCIHRPNQ